jgi:very-short-patch-repair endonuclease
VKVFVSYSHQDAEYLKDDSLLGFLKGLEKDNVEFWDDRRIRPGELWDAVIKTNLQKADIALVLVSQAFLDSPYCQNIEIEHCLAQQKHLFPIILSPCDWRRHAWPSSRQFLPGGDQTVEEHYTEAGRSALRAIFFSPQRRYETIRGPAFAGGVSRDGPPGGARRRLEQQPDQRARRLPQLQRANRNDNVGFRLARASPIRGTGQRSPRERRSPLCKRGARGDFRAYETPNMLKYNPKLKENARALRSGMTDCEPRPWSKLRRKQVLGVQFYRQKPIGDYIADFYAPKANLVVEVDGSQHLEPAQIDHDRRRTAFLESQGLRVLRFDNRQVLQELDGVMEAIYRAMAKEIGEGYS